MVPPLGKKPGRHPRRVIGVCILVGSFGIPSMASSQRNLSARPVFGREWLGGDYEEVLHAHWRAEMTLFLYDGSYSIGSIQLPRHRIGAGFGWISYGIADPCTDDRTWNSSRGHVSLNFPIHFTEGFRSYLEARVTFTQLRPEKLELGDPPEGCSQLPHTGGWGGEGVMGLEIPLFWSVLPDFHLDLSFHYGAFSTKEVTPIPGGRSMAHGRPMGLYLGILWYPSGDP